MLDVISQPVALKRSYTEGWLAWQQRESTGSPSRTGHDWKVVRQPTAELLTKGLGASGAYNKCNHDRLAILSQCI